MKSHLAVFDEIPSSLSQFIGSGLSDFNVKAKGPSHHKDLAISIEDSDGCAGGLVGFTAWGWLYIKWLWITESARCQGYAFDLLQQAETVAKERGCHAAWIDTFNLDAKRVYERFGFAVFGELADFPAGHTRYFLQKRYSV